MTNLRIYTLAYDELLRRKENEVNRGIRALNELGRESEISRNRQTKLDEEIAYLHQEIIKLEKIEGGI